MKKIFTLKIKKQNKGFTLIETLVAVMIFTSSVLALIAILSTSLSTIVHIKQKLVGTYLAQEGIEYIRNMRDSYVIYEKDDTGWASFKDKISLCIAPNYCGIDNLEPPRKEKFTFACDSPSFSLCKLYIKDGNYNIKTGGGVGGEIDSGFIRKIQIENITNDEIKIISTVLWKSGSSDKSISFSENLFNWKKLGVGITPPPPGVVATGGEEKTVGEYKIHIFKDSGKFTVTSGGEVEYLVVAGGGGGGKKDLNIGTGGGGAGGFQAGTIDFIPQTYGIVVGSGGGPSNNGGNSILKDSKLNNIVNSTGGGAGGYYSSSGRIGTSGTNGGSGGGGGYGDTSGGAVIPPTTQGNWGGFSNKEGGSGFSFGGGGGGGAGGRGSDGSYNSGGAGGLGKSSSISGSSVFYAGGGGGGGAYTNTRSTGGSGIGGNGGNSGNIFPSSGAPNTGSGGGGSSNQIIGSGGSGIVIIRYKTL